MVTKKDMVIAVLITFCFTATLFMITPSSSQLSGREYDPWLDLNDDGKIDILDLSKIAMAFGKAGTPINKTGLLLELQSELQALEAKVEALQANGTGSLPDIYESVKDSVVMILGVTTTGTVQGSGFIYNFGGSMVVVTNNHVVSGTTSVSVTFSDGNGYTSAVNGTDPYADLAVLSVVGAPETEFKPLEVVSSSTLRVGNPVLAVGNPYGLVGSMTTGVISALGRTITEQEYIGGFTIANIIQTSAPINPGNSGGPLLNFDGKVIGITAAVVADSQGLGFAIPSNTILREISSIIEEGTYDEHSYLGVSGEDMDYLTAQEMHTNVTYGWRIAQLVPGGPCQSAGVHVDDIIVGFNATRIRNGDEMSSYLEENTLPGQTVMLNIVRSNQTMQIPVVLGKRPPPG
jgi:S1-C subfamily serine protease